MVVAAAAIGLVAGAERLRAVHLDRWAAGAALAVFAVYAAPVVLSGDPTFAGYGILGDTAVHFVLIDRIMDAGTGLEGLQPSAYEQTLRNYFASGYPLGAHAALGAVRPLAGVDVAWAFQPFLAYIASMLALTITALLSRVVSSRWRAALIAALVAQPALVYASSSRAAIKELATLWLVPLLVALVPGITDGADRRAESGGRAQVGPRDVIPLAVASAASVAVIGVAVLPWLGPVLLVALWQVWRRRPRSLLSVAVPAVAFAAGLAVLSLPTLLDLGDYLRVTKKVVTAQQELGNLLQPLDDLQLFGVLAAGGLPAVPHGGRRALGPGRHLPADRRGGRRRAARPGPPGAPPGARSAPLRGHLRGGPALRHARGFALGRRQGTGDRLSGRVLLAGLGPWRSRRSERA